MSKIKNGGGGPSKNVSREASMEAQRSHRGRKGGFVAPGREAMFVMPGDLARERSNRIWEEQDRQQAVLVKRNAHLKMVRDAAINGGTPTDWCCAILTGVVSPEEIVSSLKVQRENAKAQVVRLDEECAALLGPQGILDSPDRWRAVTRYDIGTVSRAKRIWSEFCQSETLRLREQKADVGASMQMLANGIRAEAHLAKAMAEAQAMLVQERKLKTQVKAEAKVVRQQELKQDMELVQVLGRKADDIDWRARAEFRRLLISSDI